MTEAEFSTTFTVFPQHCNYNSPPSIFGGKMLAEMDNAAAMSCRRFLYGTECTDAITVSVEKVNFTRPAYIGEIVLIKSSVIKAGEKSITVLVDCHREDKTGTILKMASGIFVFCARKNGVPHKHGKSK
jgi:acyl-CoA hydrolase